METLVDVIARGIRKFHGTERQDLLVLASLSALQLGEEYPDMSHVLYPVLNSVLQDSTISPGERGCVSA